MSELPNISGPSAPAAIATQPVTTSRPLRLGFWALGLGLLGLGVWAAWAPLDEGVSASATVAIETRRNTIQHFSGGIVRQVSVKEGQSVKAGETLLELDDGMARANLESVRQNYLGLRAEESRLLAERAGNTQIEFHPDLLAASDEAQVQQHLSAQRSLFAARRAALESERRGAEHSIAALQAQIAGYGDMLSSRQTQQQVLADQTTNLRMLAEQGYAPRNQVLQLEQSRAELSAVIADLIANRQRAEKGIAEIRQRIAQREQEYLKEVSTQLAAVRREVQAGAERQSALEAELTRVQITSPVDGQVVGLAVTAVGGVLSPGQKLMDIVPNVGPLLLDAKIPPHVIDRVRRGSPADIRLSAFAHAPDLVLPATVVSISSDVVTENTPAGAVSYYLARLQISDVGQQRLGDRQLQPGMPAEVVIKTGERSLLTYLLHPLRKRMAAAMIEE